MIPETIRKKRLELGISQSELARRIGARRATICEFESGKRGINSKTLGLILKELRIELI